MKEEIEIIHQGASLVDYDCGFAWVVQDFRDSRDFGGNTSPGVFVRSKAHNRRLKILLVSTGLFFMNVKRKYEK
jgi:hypothetical protein